MGDRTASPFLKLQMQTGSTREAGSPTAHRHIPPFPRSYESQKSRRWANVNLKNIAALFFTPHPFFFSLKKKPSELEFWEENENFIFLLVAHLLSTTWYDFWAQNTIKDISQDLTDLQKELHKLE